MDRFLERNKRKGALAAALLLLKKGKGVVPIAAMAAVMAVIFVVPSGLHEKVPFLGTFAEKLGLRAPASSGIPNHEKIQEALDAARRNRPDFELAKLRSGLPPSQYGRSTVDFVKKDALPDKPSASPDIAKGSGKSVEGVLRPEDSKKMESGVPLANEELGSGLMNKALSDTVSNAEAAFSDKMGLKDGGSSSGGGSYSQGKADDKGANMVAAALDGTNVPKVGTGSGMAPGKLGWATPKSNARIGRAVGASGKSGGKNTVMYQLAEGRAYSIAAAPPPGYCNPGPCPGEYASNAGGAPFDGNRAKGAIVTSTEFGDNPAAVTPDMGAIGGLSEEAMQLEKDAKACEQAHAKYAPQEEQKMAEIQALSDQLNDMDCGGGDCGGNASKCKKVGDQIEEKCREYNAIQQQHASACPLMNGKFTAMDCDQ